MDPLASQIQQLTAQLNQLTQENDLLKQKLKLCEEKLSATLDGTGLCLWEQHIPSGDLTIFNQEWGALLGYTLEERAANISSWKSHLHPEDKDWVIKAFEDHLTGKEEVYRAVHRMIHKNGTTSWVSDRGRIVEYTPDGQPLRIMGTHIDITQEKRYELDLARLAHQDPLTDLLNRTAIETAFQQIQKNTNFQSGTLLFIDVDNFKGVNDRYGHHFGDLVLVEISNTLNHYCQKLISKHKVSIARLGGDEFVIITAIADFATISMFAEALINHFKQLQTIDDKPLSLGLSIGISRFNQRDQFTHVCEQADNAMYGVKQSGKHNYSFWQQSVKIKMHQLG
ncbi:MULTISPECIES: sensor domain-containing diguanylate cyclase [unclassified Shewanella]|uniref:sensor domain-containing diguanylate cyclase n=1 Tax=unclassified Shewanella TaxID=196818 RepID=UPI000C868174|nr:MULTISPECIES: sensor domain-containing diguanylate cyclase [unclassified Shewanella]MDO6617932.1 sensor domain-containing diguanylate cyclase [Shewanella sp. 6_MG-2023]MDO6639942.1 sensor domain-containing diguanylate cyclase [Shewanella sp. 5_MG-2023]PMG40371.1 diguanylate cyclase [Shewanella sp. 10N.286.52.B9]